MSAEQETKAPKEVKTLSYDKYVKSKCIIGYGIVNGLINALIFFFINRGTPAFNQQAILMDIAITSVAIGLILTWIVIPLTKSDLKKGAFEKSENLGLGAKLPANWLLLSLIVAVICLVVGIVLAFIVTLIIPMVPFVAEMIIKAVICAIVGYVAGYFVIGSVAAHN